MFGDYENIYTLNTAQDHANIFNKAIKSDCIVIHGETFEAYELASSVRNAVNKYGNPDAKVYVIEESAPEMLRTFSDQIHKAIKLMMFANGVTVLSNSEIDKVQSKPYSETLDTLVLNDTSNGNEITLHPDMIICENAIDQATIPLNKIYHENPDVRQPMITEKGVPYVDTLSSLKYKDQYSSIFAAGSASAYQSAYQDNMIRTADPNFEVDTGFFAGLAMMNKRIGYRDVPMSTFSLFGYDLAYIGQRNPIYTDLVIEGNPENMEFICYLYNGEKTSKEADTRGGKKKLTKEPVCVGILV